jgi:hypothetical protein
MMHGETTAFFLRTLEFIKTSISPKMMMLASPDFYAKPRSEIFQLETQLKTARDKVAYLYARWQELELLQSVPRTTETSSDM